MPSLPLTVSPLGPVTMIRSSKAWVPTEGRENSSANARSPCCWSGKARASPKPYTAGSAAIGAFAALELGNLVVVALAGTGGEQHRDRKHGCGDPVAAAVAWK